MYIHEHQTPPHFAALRLGVFALKSRIPHGPRIFRLFPGKGILPNQTGTKSNRNRTEIEPKPNRNRITVANQHSKVNRNRTKSGSNPNRTRHDSESPAQNPPKTEQNRTNGSSKNSLSGAMNLVTEATSDSGAERRDHDARACVAAFETPQVLECARFAPLFDTREPLHHFRLNARALRNRAHRLHCIWGQCGLLFAPGIAFIRGPGASSLIPWRNPGELWVRCLFWNWK
jgi:hypothetical protein